MPRISTILFGAVLASLAAGGLAQTGDFMCNQYLCVTAILNGSTTSIEVLVTGGYDTFGWISTGFGSQMGNSPMVVLWPNSDGSITLSQRLSSGHDMPTVVPSPPRVATLDMGLSTLGSSQTRLTYTIPSDSSTTQNMIWAISAMRPPSSAVDAVLIQHYDQGAYTLDLSKPLSSLSPSLTASFPAVVQSTSTPSSSNPVSNPEAPFTSTDQRIVIHAVLSSVGFAVLMPLGSLWARYARTFVAQWFLVHWIVNFWIALPVALAGFAYGVYIMHTGDGPHASTTHTTAGFALLAIVAIQWILGFVVHYVKPVGGWSRRPPQNYGHAVLGIVTIALAFFTVYMGFTLQWPVVTGRLAPTAMTVLFAIWVAVITCGYLAGLFFLPRQYRQERERKAAQQEAAEPEMVPLRRRD